MEARATLRGPRVSRTLVAGVLVIVALGVGAVGGYVAAGLGGGKAASPSHVAPLAKAVPVQTKAVLPDWIVQEITPKTAPAQRILTDDIIRNARPADVPAWIVQEFPPMEAPTSRIQQDDIIRNAGPAAAACPAGTHMEVWYMAKTTSCASDLASQSGTIVP
jgi:hypothetical protein